MINYLLTILVILIIICFRYRLVLCRDRMSADECLEHKWLIETNQSLKMPLENGIMTVEQTTIQSNGDDESNKSNGIDYVTESSPPKTSTGFFLHQQNPNKSRTFLKQNHTSNSPNNHCNNISAIVGPPNNANELLRDFATNKENINLSKILANRNQSSTQLLNNLNKGSTTTITTTPQSSSAQIQLNNNISDEITAVQQTKMSNVSAIMVFSKDSPPPYFQKNTIRLKIYKFNELLYLPF